MVIRRGEVWWVNLPSPSGSGPGFLRPAVVVSADPYNSSRIGTVIVVVMTTNLSRADAPGNLRLSKRESGLKRVSVANVTQLATVDKRRLTEKVKRLPQSTMSRIDHGLRQALSLSR
jgi:mRNA interferase MazF